MVKIRKMQQKTRKKRKMRGGSGGPRRIEQFSKEALDDLKRRLIALNDGQPLGFTEKGLAHLKKRLIALNDGDLLGFTEKDKELLKNLQIKLDNTNKIKTQLDNDPNLDKNLAAARRAAERAAEKKPAAAAGEEGYVMVDVPAGVQGVAGPRRTVKNRIASTAVKTATKAKNKVKKFFTGRGGAKSRKRKRTRHKRRKSHKGVTRRKRR